MISDPILNTISSGYSLMTNDTSPLNKDRQNFDYSGFLMKESQARIALDTKLGNTQGA